jgi:hypothetical protein
MHLESFTYDLATRSWSVPALPHLDAASTLVLAFGAPEMVAHPNVFQLLRDAYPSSSLIGCSSAGVIAGAEVRDRALSVVVAKFDRTKLRMAAALARDATGSRAAGVTLARKLLGPRLRAVLILAEGLRIDGDALVTGIRSVVGEEVVVAGGLAGDDVRFERTWVCSGNRLQSGLIAGVGFYGDELYVGCGSESGWDRFGPERQVTRAEGNTLYELDNGPAADVYKRYLGERLAGLPAAGMLYPLALWPPDDRDAFAVRPLIAADAASGALVFTGSVPEGYRAQLMRTDADRLLHSAVDAALAATRAASIPGTSSGNAARTSGEPGREAPAVLGIAVSGMGRRMALGERADEELKAARRALPPGAVTAGFYGYGEIAPGEGGRCRLQHQSMTVLVLGEPGRPAPKEISAGVPVRTATTADSGPQTLSQISLSAMAEEEEEDEVTGTANVPLGAERPPTSGFAEVTSFVRDLDTGIWSVSPLPGLDSPRTLVLVLASSEARAHPRAFADLRLAYPRSHIIGGSSAGEILGGDTYQRSMVVAVMRFAHTELASAQVALGTSRDGEAAGRALGRELARSDLRALLVFSSAPAITGEALMAGLRAEVGADVLITGAASAGGARGEHSWVLARGTLARQAVAAVALYGDHVIVGHGARVGWSDIGPARKISRSQGGVLLGLDGQPALDLYQEALGASKGVPGPIPVALVGEGGERRWRVVVGMDDRQRSLTLAGGIPPAHQVQLVRTGVDQILGSAAEAATTAGEAAGRTGPNALGLLLGNTLRHMALGERAAQEIDAVSGALPGIRLIGGYARGAISSEQSDESAVAITVLGESPTPRYGRASAAVMAAMDAAHMAGEDDGVEATRTIGSLKAEEARTSDSGPRTEPMNVPTRKAPGASSSSRSATGATSSLGSLSSSGLSSGLSAGSSSGSAPASGPSSGVPKRFASSGSSGASMSSGAVRSHSRPSSAMEEPEPFEIAAFAYDAAERRWSVPAFPALDSPRTMVLAFGAPELASTPEVFTELRRAYPRAHVLGCSTSGEIVGSEVRDRSLSVAVVRFSRTTLATASVVVGDAAGSFPAGQVLAHKLHEPGLRAIVLLAEGLEIGGSELLRGIKSVIDDTVVITGGLAGDGLRFQRTWVLSGDAVQSSLVTAVGLYGDYVSVGQGAEGGWQPLGPSGTITRSSGNVLLEIDGRPALAWYREHLGEHASGLPATGLLFPLGLEMKDASLGFLARTVMAIDEGVESMTLAGDMPQNASVHLLGAVSAQLIEGARVAAEGAADEVETMGEIGLGLLVSAVGRRVVLGDRSGDELAAAAAALPEGVTTTGFYAYGGFAAFRGRATELFNQTFLATVITEADEPLTRPTAAAVSASTSMPRTFSTASAPTPLQASLGGHRASQRLRRAGPRAGELTSRDVGGVRVIELGGQIDEAFDGRAVAAALGQVTVLDLAGVERVSSHGVREWVQMMELVDVEALYLARCAEPLVNQLLLVRAMIGQASVISFAAPYVCKECDHAFVHMLDCEHDAAAIAAAEPPEVPCPRCGRSARFDDDLEAYRAFFEPHLGRPVPAAVRRALGAVDASGPSGTGPSITFTDPMPAGWPVPAGWRAWPALRSAAVGALVMGVILAAVYWTLLRPSRTGAASRDSDSALATATAPPAVDGGPGSTPARSGELPPAWVDRAFDVQADEVLVVGRSGVQDDVHDAVDAAYRDAVCQLLVHMVPYLEGSPIYGYLRTNLDLSSLREPGARPHAARMVARYQLQVGHAAMPVRVDAVRVERDGQVSIVGYYRLSKVEFERVLAYYRAAERALGMTVVPVFPLLAADMPGQSDLLVSAVEQSSPADRAGVAAGDLIVSVGGRDVSSLEEYALVANQRWAMTRSRRALDLELFRSGAQVIRSLKKR